MTRPLLASALLALALTLAGASCSSTASNIVNIREGGDSDVLVGNPSLLADLAVDNVITRRRDDHRLEFKVNLTNKTSTDLRFQWRVEWYDGQGFLLDDPTRAWKADQLVGKDTRAIQQISLSPDAVKARLHIERPNEITN